MRFRHFFIAGFEVGLEEERMFHKRAIVFPCSVGNPEDDARWPSPGGHVHRLPEQAAEERDDRSREGDHDSQAAEQGNGRSTLTPSVAETVSTVESFWGL